MKIVWILECKHCQTAHSVDPQDSLFNLKIAIPVSGPRVSSYVVQHRPIKQQKRSEKTSECVEALVSISAVLSLHFKHVKHSDVMFTAQTPLASCRKINTQIYVLSALLTESSDQVMHVSLSAKIKESAV